jgi:Sigma-70, region 4
MAEAVPTTTEIAPPSSGGDYVVQIKIKNGPLLRAIRATGATSPRAWAREHGIQPQSVYGYLTLKQAPLLPTGEWRRDILRIAEALKLAPFALFPEQHLDKALLRSAAEIEMTWQDAGPLLTTTVVDSSDPHRDLERRDLNTAIERVLGNLDARHERAVRLAFGLDGAGERSLEEVGQELGGLSREGARQVVAKAIRKLSHPNNRQVLIDAGGDAVIPDEDLPGTKMDRALATLKRRYPTPSPPPPPTAGEKRAALTKLINEYLERREHELCHDH